MTVGAKMLSEQHWINNRKKYDKKYLVGAHYRITE